MLSTQVTASVMKFCLEVSFHLLTFTRQILKPFSLTVTLRVHWKKAAREKASFLRAGVDNKERVFKRWLKFKARCHAVYCHPPCTVQKKRIDFFLVCLPPAAALLLFLCVV